MDEQTGAHVDCPAYMLPEQMDKTIDTYPVNVLFAPAVKYNLSEIGILPGEYVTREDIPWLEEEIQDSVSEGEIALLDFGWMQYWASDANWKHYALDVPGLSEDAAALFAERKVKAVGTDTIACDTPIVNGKEYFSYSHKKYWLPNGILMMKMLANLDKLPTRSYFMAIPLKIKNGSGSPIRPLAFIE